MDTHGKPRFLSSLRKGGTHRQFFVALALVSALPFLLIWYVGSHQSQWMGDLPGVLQTLIILTAFAIFVTLGYTMLKSYPDNVSRLRDYLTRLVSGAFPDGVSLITDEDDMNAIEASLNVIMKRLRERISLMEAEKQRLEKQLFQAQKLETIGTLAAGMTHEINTPVQFVRDNTQYVGDCVAKLLPLLAAYRRHARRADTDAPPKEILRLEKDIDVDFLEKDITQAIAECQQGLSRVVDIAAAMRNYLHHRKGDGKTPLDLNAVIHETVMLSRCEWKHVAEIETCLDPAVPAVEGLPGELRQALMNLIINAAHAIGESENRQPDDKGRIRISSRHEPGRAVLTVEDTGPGIPEKVRDRMFERLFTTKPEGKGTGLGLPLTHAFIVDHHGGSLTFDTAIGQGTTFTIVLPACESVDSEVPA